jgi:deoxyribonuclease-4
MTSARRMTSARPRLGLHMPLAAGMVKAADRAREIGANAIQVFADNPTAWKRRAEPPPEQGAFTSRLAEHDVRPLVIHASYLVNLAGADTDFRERSVAVLISDLRAAPGFGARYVNVHTGSHRDTSVEEGIRRVVEGAAHVLAEVDDGPDSPMLVLENSAGGGWTVGVSVEEIARIADSAAALGIPERRLGFCIDTAHAWGAGIRMDEPDAIDAFVEDFDHLVGLDRLVLVHLNDSRAEPGSRHDRHEHIGGGRIGSRGLGHVLRHPRLSHATFILETPGMDEGYDLVNMRRALDLAEGRELEPLPAEAFKLKGSRAKGAAPSAAPAPTIEPDGD